MNILPLNINTPQYVPSFSAKPKLAKVNSLKSLVSDVVEISSKGPEILPPKLGFTELEEAYSAVWMKLRVLEMNIITQKNNLKFFYSAQDRLDYQALLKDRQTLLRKLKTISKGSGSDMYGLEKQITVKKEYNRYASKIYRVKTSEELNQIENLISEDTLYDQSIELLNRLVAQRRTMII